MAERIRVDASGIWAGYRHSREDYLWPWAEVVDAAVYVLELPSHERLVYLDISHTSGEFLEFTDTAEGFGEAIAALAARAGRRLPDLSTLQGPDGHVRIY